MLNQPKWRYMGWGMCGTLCRATRMQVVLPRTTEAVRCGSKPSTLADCLNGTCSHLNEESERMDSLFSKTQLQEIPPCDFLETSPRLQSRHHPLSFSFSGLLVMASYRHHPLDSLILVLRFVECQDLTVVILILIFSLVGFVGWAN